MTVTESSLYRPDDLDRRIIAHLRIDGRASLSKLSDVLALRAAPFRTDSTG